MRNTWKKDQLKKAERPDAEKHLLKFAEMVYQSERRRNSANAFSPRASFLPARILTTILDVLLTIHFPDQLRDLLSKSWKYYPRYGTLLFDSIIAIQTSIQIERNQAHASSLARQREKREQQRANKENEASRPRLILKLPRRANKENEAPQAAPSNAHGSADSTNAPVRLIVKLPSPRSRVRSDAMASTPILGQKRAATATPTHELDDTTSQAKRPKPRN
ncbi:hypothetical protein CPC08DRAFT_562902 [Agrocybe pediades]|nr:hypothetical protein CPC08DRAFT_562902 [Agrocybe pediades]